MDALILCGGEGTRLDFDGEKPLFEVGGVPMIDRVISALEASRVETIYAVGSPAVPETAAHVDVPYIETSGEGYVEDLTEAMEEVEPPVLTVAADLPLLDGPAIDWVLDQYRAGSSNPTGSLSVYVPVALKESLGVSIETSFEHEGQQIAPGGVNVVGEPEPETILMNEDTRFAVNVNRPRDATVAEAHL